MSTSSAKRNRTITLPRLHHVEYGSPKASDIVVCLPGLTRTADDFDRLARALAKPSNGRKRRILALDYRGRGGSGWDSNWRHYDLTHERADILETLAVAGVARAIFIGTSRGGLHIMLLAFLQPLLLRAAVLNDIGPAIELAGLKRIKSYVGKAPRFDNWKGAVEALRRNTCRDFPGVDDDDMMTYARQTFALKNGKFRLRYDPALARTVPKKSPEGLWPCFEALKHIPVLGLRGANSDILSAETFAQMQARHPAFEAHTVEGQGHAPLLLDPPTIAKIVGFVDRVPPDKAK